jgi:hypothetical protein
MLFLPAPCTLCIAYTYRPNFIILLLTLNSRTYRPKLFFMWAYACKAFHLVRDSWWFLCSLLVLSAISLFLINFLLDVKIGIGLGLIGASQPFMVLLANGVLLGLAPPLIMPSIQAHFVSEAGKALSLC